MIRSAALIAAGFIAGGAASATAAQLVTGAQVKNGTLTGRDIKNRSIRTADLAPSARPAQGPQGATGPQGPRGAAGPQGAQGPRTTFTTVEDETGIEFHGTVRTFDVFVNCPPGQSPVGGGYRIVHSVNESPADDADIYILRSSPFVGVQAPPRAGWWVTVRNNGTPGISIHVTAICQ